MKYLTLNNVNRTFYAAIIVGMSMAANVYAVDENNVAPGLTYVGAPLGAHGVDTVSMINLHNQHDGLPEFASKHDGVAYYFSNAKNKATFDKKPEAFIPQNGGFCTYGVSVGKKFDGNPKYAAVVDGKLYLFLNEDVLKLFLEDKKGTIVKANQQWKKIRSVSATEL